MTVAAIALLAGVCTLAAIAAAAAAVAFARGWTPAARRRGQQPARVRRAVEALPEAWRERYRPLLVVAAVAAVGVWILTGWPVHGLLTGAAVAALPYVLQQGHSPKARIEMLEALADWLNQMAGVHVQGVSLEATVRSSAKSAPAVIRPRVQRLAARLQQGWPPEDAYRALADDFADGVIDHVVLLLQSHARDRGRGLAAALEALAQSLARQTEDARNVEADRAKVRASARWISLFVLAIVTGLMINRTYTAPYGTPSGQLLLAVLGGLFGLLLLLMHRKGRPVPQPRLLAPHARRGMAGETTGNVPADERGGR